MTQRVKILDTSLKELKNDERIFSMLGREAGRISDNGNRLADDANVARATQAEQVSAVIEQLAATRGPVSDWLNDAARSMVQGTSKVRAARGFADQVRTALDEGGLAALQGETPTLRGQGVDEPGGLTAQRQVETMELDLGDVTGPAKRGLDDAERTGALKDVVEACKL